MRWHGSATNECLLSSFIWEILRFWNLIPLPLYWSTLPLTTTWGDCDHQIDDFVLVHTKFGMVCFASPPLDLVNGEWLQPPLLQPPIKAYRCNHPRFWLSSQKRKTKGWFGHPSSHFKVLRATLSHTDCHFKLKRDDNNGSTIVAAMSRVHNNATRF